MVMMAARASSDLCITVCGEAAPLKLVKDRRAKCMRLSMNAATRGFRLTLPRWVSAREGLAFVAERQALLEKWWQASPAPPVLAGGSSLLWRGALHVLEHDPAAGRQVRVEADKIIVGGPAELLAPRLLRWMRAEAKIDLTVRTQTIAAAHQLRVSHITVRDMRARWGSCTSSGRISLCWRLMLAPDAVRTYVVAHELAHLKHMDHSPAFWREVERLGGDLSTRDWIKRYGADVMRFG
jgi:predicted metal-dependent hydrolase